MVDLAAKDAAMEIVEEIEIATDPAVVAVPARAVVAIADAETTHARTIDVSSCGELRNIGFLS